MGSICGTDSKAPNKKISPKADSNTDSAQSNKLNANNSTVKASFENNYTHPVDPLAENEEFWENRGRPSELIGYFKSIYESCNKIIVIFQLVKTRKPLLESFTKFLNVIKEALLLSVSKQQDFLNEKVDSFLRFDTQLKNYSKYLDELDLKELNNMSENDPYYENFIRNLTVIEKHFNDLNASLKLHPNALSLTKIIEGGKKFEEVLKNDEAKSKFFGSFRCTDCAEFWYVALGQETDATDIDSFGKAFQNYQTLRKAFPSKPALERFMSKLKIALGNNTGEKVMPKDCERFFIKTWIDNYERRKLFEEKRKESVVEKKQMPHQSRTIFNRLEILFVEPGNSFYQKGYRIRFDGKVIEEVDSNNNFLESTSPKEEGKMLVGRIGDNIKPEINFPPHNSLISRHQCLIQTQIKGKSLIYTLNCLSSKNPTYLRLNNSQPMMLTQSLVFQIGSKVCMSISEIFPEPFFYPEANNAHLLSVDRYANNKFIRGEGSKASISEQRASIKMKLFMKNDKGDFEKDDANKLIIFQTIEKDCSPSEKFDFNVGSSPEADQEIKKASDVSLFHFDVFFEKNIGWYIKNRAETSGLILFFSSLEDLVEQKPQTHPVILKDGMNICFGDVEVRATNNQA